MDTNQTPQQIITSALQLPPEQRAAIADALLVSIPIEDSEYGVLDSATEVDAAWSDEIERRLNDIDRGRVKTIPAEEAERMIRGNERPEV